MSAHFHSCDRKLQPLFKQTIKDHYTHQISHQTALFGFMVLLYNNENGQPAVFSSIISGMNKELLRYIQVVGIDRTLL